MPNGRRVVHASARKNVQAGMKCNGSDACDVSFQRCSARHFYGTPAVQQPNHGGLVLAASCEQRDSWMEGKRPNGGGVAVQRRSACAFSAVAVQQPQLGSVIVAASSKER